MSNDREVRRRHVWVSGAGPYHQPGLIIAWRRTSDSAGWEAYVARAHGDGTALLAWEPADRLRPVTDDRHDTNPKAPRQ